jgi:thioredoxin
VPVLVDFHADWCGPCKVSAPHVDSLAGAHAGELLVLKVDTDRNPRIATRFNIRGIPAFLVFRNGQETNRHIGLADERVLTALVGL